MAYILAQHGHWDFKTYRETPFWLMQQVFFVWELDGIVNKYHERKSKQQSNKGAKS